MTTTGMLAEPIAYSQPVENGTPGVGIAAVARSDLQFIDGLLSGVRWAAPITYSFPDSVADYQTNYPSQHLQGFSVLNAAQMTAVHYGLNAANWNNTGPGHFGFSVEGFTNLDISFVPGGNGDATIRLGNNTNANTAYAFYPDIFTVSGDAWFGPSGKNPAFGNYDYHTVIHEIGHALGLKHGHETDVYGALPLETDSMEYTVMTYRSFVGQVPGAGYANETWGYAQTFMMHDIAALQHMYGADFTTNAGDTVYSWDPNSGATYVNGNVAITPGGNRIFMTIWDGGGNDTYNLSNYTSDLKVDLNPGYHSVFASGQLAYLGGGPNGGYARGNVFNALLYNGDLRSLIENAIGGSGNDHIVGNVANNQLYGNAGQDTLEGGAGNDTLIGDDGNDSLNGGDGNDVLHGGAGDDTLDGSGDIGTHSMYGGAGNDVYHVRSAYDTTVEDEAQGANGVDHVFAYVEWVLAAGTENLTVMGDGDLKGTGNGLANVIQGNGGANALLGLGGQDTLQGLGGADDLRGGAGGDALEGGQGADKLRGDAGADTLSGGGGADTLAGGAGKDILAGGAGRDTLAGGLGNDEFHFALPGEGRDRVLDFSNAAGDNDRFTFHAEAFGGLALGKVLARHVVANASGTATKADHLFIYETDTGILRFDGNGSAAGGVSVLAILDGAPALTVHDLFIV